MVLPNENIIFWSPLQGPIYSFIFQDFAVFARFARE